MVLCIIICERNLQLELHLPKELVDCILPLSLPASYNTLVTTLEAQAEVPNLEFVSMALLNEEGSEGLPLTLDQVQPFCADRKHIMVDLPNKRPRNLKTRIVNSEWDILQEIVPFCGMKIRTDIHMAKYLNEGSCEALNLINFVKKHLLCSKEARNQDQEFGS